MNKIIIFIGVIFSLMFFSCNSKERNDNGVIDELQSRILFKNDVYNFGLIPAKKDASAVFKFSNTGNSPIIIAEVKTTCGCTVPEYPKGIIKPNENGNIKVVYDAKYPGRFNKTITVHYNGKDSPKELTIKGEVPYPKEMDSVTN